MYLIHGQRVAAGADQRDEPEGERIRVGDKHLDEIQAAHEVHREAAENASGLKDYTWIFV